MASAPTREAAQRGEQFAEHIPADGLGPLRYRDLSEPPPLRKLIGPSVGPSAINSRFLPEPIGIRGVRLAALLCAFGFSACSP